MLLRALARHPDRVLGRDVLLDMAAADSLDAGHRAIGTRVARLRRKLDTETIVTVREHGGPFVPPAAAQAGQGDARRALPRRGANAVQSL